MKEAEIKTPTEEVLRTDELDEELDLFAYDAVREESCLDTYEPATVFLGNHENYVKYIENLKGKSDSPGFAYSDDYSSVSSNNGKRHDFKFSVVIKEMADSIWRDFAETLKWCNLRKNGISCVLFVFLCFYIILLSRSLTDVTWSMFMYLMCIYLVTVFRKPGRSQSIFLVFIGCVGVLLGSYNQYIQSQYFAVSIGEWIDYFTDKRFDRCDDLAYGTTDLILPENKNSTGTLKNSEDMYIYILDTIVDDIEDISYNDSTHKVTVKYRVFKESDKIVIDNHEVEKLRDKYISNELADEDFKLGIQKLYFESFKNTVVSRKTDEVEQSAVEMRLIDGKVEGGYTLVKEILDGSGIYDNMEMFERDIKSTIDVLVRSEN